MKLTLFVCREQRLYLVSVKNNKSQEEAKQIHRTFSIDILTNTFMDKLYDLHKQTTTTIILKKFGVHVQNYLAKQLRVMPL